MIRSTLIILFGAVPASALSWFAGLAVAIGIVEASDGRLDLLYLSIWGLFGIWGTIALWVAAFGLMNRFVYFGLLAGILAISPLVLNIGFPAGHWKTDIWAFGSASTAIVAIYLLVESVIRTRESAKRQVTNGH